MNYKMENSEYISVKDDFGPWADEPREEEINDNELIKEIKTHIKTHLCDENTFKCLLFESDVDKIKNIIKYKVRNILVEYEIKKKILDNYYIKIKIIDFSTSGDFGFSVTIKIQPVELNEFYSVILNFSAEKKAAFFSAGKKADLLSNKELLQNIESFHGSSVAQDVEKWMNKVREENELL